MRNQGIFEFLCQCDMNSKHAREDICIICLIFLIGIHKNYHQQIMFHIVSFGVQEILKINYFLQKKLLDKVNYSFKTIC